MTASRDVSGTPRGRAGLFPGQGVPLPKVAAELPRADPLVATAGEVLGIDLWKEVKEALSAGGMPPTTLAQPAIFVCGVAAWRRRDRQGDRFDFFAGHSLGEYAALVAADAWSFEDALKVLAVRADGMQAVARSVPGGMAAVINLGRNEVDRIAQDTGVGVANDNCPGQVVVSGPEDGLSRAADAVKAAGGRYVRLEIAGPFHHPAVAPTVPILETALEGVEIREPQVPVVANLTARPYASADEIRRLLPRHLTVGVRWRETIEWMWEQGAREFVDLGPGQIVAGLAQRTIGEREKAGAYDG